MWFTFFRNLLYTYIHVHTLKFESTTPKVRLSNTANTVRISISLPGTWLHLSACNRLAWSRSVIVGDSGDLARALAIAVLFHGNSLAINLGLAFWIFMVARLPQWLNYPKILRRVFQLLKWMNIVRHAGTYQESWNSWVWNRLIAMHHINKSKILKVLV